MNVKTPVRRLGHVVVDADGAVICAIPHTEDPEPLRDVVLMLNFQDHLIKALVLWEYLFSGKEAKSKLAEMVGRDEANAVLAQTMIALNPQLWKLASERDAKQRKLDKAGRAAADAFPALVSLLGDPDTRVVLEATIGEDGIGLLSTLTDKVCYA